MSLHLPHFSAKKRDNEVTEGRFPVLKVLNFFSQIFNILYMRLKFRRVGLLDHQNMPKPIPHWSKNHFFQKRPIQQFIHNLGSHVWTSCRPPALEFVLYIHFDNSAHEDSGVECVSFMDTVGFIYLKIEILLSWYCSIMNAFISSASWNNDTK